mmetsp:Transcript_2603/g.6278  ORF Transcript_2603/g.6278 Transcript_2603/m.6278 type:complete len:308 (-) Transcript_2603:166-1089(-)
MQEVVTNSSAAVTHCRAGVRILPLAELISSMMELPVVANLVEVYERIPHVLLPIPGEAATHRANSGCRDPAVGQNHYFEHVVVPLRGPLQLTVNRPVDGENVLRVGAAVDWTDHCSSEANGVPRADTQDLVEGSRRAVEEGTLQAILCDISRELRATRLVEYNHSCVLRSGISQTPAIQATTSQLACVPLILHLCCHEDPTLIRLLRLDVGRVHPRCQCLVQHRGFQRVRLSRIRLLVTGDVDIGSVLKAHRELDSGVAICAGEGHSDHVAFAVARRDKRHIHPSRLGPPGVLLHDADFHRVRLGTH